MQINDDDVDEDDDDDDDGGDNDDVVLFKSKITFVSFGADYCFVSRHNT